MNDEQAKALVIFLSVGIKVLSARIMLLLTTLLTFSLFCWAMYLPGYERIALVTIFSLLVFIPVIRLDARSADSRTTERSGS